MDIYFATPDAAFVPWIRFLLPKHATNDILALQNIRTKVWHL